MQIKSLVFAAALMPLVFTSIPFARGEAASSLPLIALTEPDNGNRMVPSSDQVTISQSKAPATPGLEVKIAPGKETYPGVRFKPEGAVWNLSAFGHIQMRVVNTGTSALNLTMRVENKGDWHDSPWNIGNAKIMPGASGTVTVVFGYSGRTPGYALKTEEVSGVLLFASKSNSPQSFRIETIEAAGPAGEKPAVNPDFVQVKPKDGFLLGGGAGVDAAKQVTAVNAQSSVEGTSLKIVFAPQSSAKAQAVKFKPVSGRWNLSDFMEVHVKLKNVGQTPANPRVVLVSGGGETDEARLAAPLKPGESGEIVVNFMPAVPCKLVDDPVKGHPAKQEGTGTKFASNTVNGIKIIPASTDASESILIESIRAGIPAPTQLPAWSGKKPPVDGEWVQTFDEEFDGKTLDETKWNTYAANFWDKRSHFSKQNVTVENGVARLRFEKKPGFHNDDPAQKKTDYATGFLDTYGKWVQRYGYFETRLKPNTAPGMWPAFWLMPDRGVNAGPQWKRADTANNGMEFDIWEFLSRWGLYRYNIAMHWDGYGKNHKATGAIAYVMPDKDGYITCGLLWTPGVAVIYANGKEVCRWESPRISSIESDIMFTNVSGGWDNDPIDDAKLPGDLLIDYVRVWQRKDLASPVDGAKVPDNSAPAAR